MIRIILYSKRVAVLSWIEFMTRDKKEGKKTENLTRELSISESISILSEMFEHFVWDVN